MTRSLTDLLLPPLVSVCIGCSSARDPASGLPLAAPGERHVHTGSRAGGVWLAYHPGDHEHVTILYRNGIRLPADAPQVMWLSRPGVPLAWSGVPAFPAAAYPLVLFARADRFVAARRAADGTPVTAVRPPRR